MWIEARDDGNRLRTECAGLARGDDPALERSACEPADEHAGGTVRA